MEMPEIQLLLLLLLLCIYTRAQLRILEFFVSKTEQYLQNINE